MQDKQQKGELQLICTFLPCDCSTHGSQHESRSPYSNTRVSVDAEVIPQEAEHRVRGAAEPASESNLFGDSLGPLGESFMHLAMTHISPGKADGAPKSFDTESVRRKSLDGHGYLQIGVAPQGNPVSHAVPPLAPGQLKGPRPAPPKQRNFYPEEASDEEVEVHGQRSRRASAPEYAVAALPPDFRCQQPQQPAESRPTANCTVDNASYSPQEVYQSYGTGVACGSQQGLHSSLSQYGAYRAPGQGPGQAYNQQPLIPQWQLLGTSPLHKGQQHADMQLQQQLTGHEQRQRYEQQPHVPQWRLLGTSPLHEGQMQHLEQPHTQQQVFAGQHSQPPGQGYSQQFPGQAFSQQYQGQSFSTHSQGQGHQLQPQRPDHLMNGRKSGYTRSDKCPLQSQPSLSFTFPGKGSSGRPLSYASSAVNSWTDKMSPVPLLGRPTASQVTSHLTACMCQCALPKLVCI